MEVCGDLPLDRLDLFFTEETLLHTSSPYSSRKASADLFTFSYYRTFGLPQPYRGVRIVLLVDMIESEKYGIYHATNEGFSSWYEFVCEIFKQAGMNVKVVPVESSAYPTKAKRPRNSGMSKDKLVENGFERLPTWQDALGRYLPA